MIFAFEEGYALRLVTRTETGLVDLMKDADCEALFSFATADVRSLSNRIHQYIESRIDFTDLDTLDPEEDFSLGLCQQLANLHPFFSTCGDAGATLLDIIATTFNVIMEGNDPGPTYYAELFEHIVEPVRSRLDQNEKLYLPCDFDLENMISRYYSEFMSIKEEATTRYSWNKRDADSLPSLQNYVRLYLYWILDSSAARFRNMSTETRIRLFSRVFGSFNEWQPLALKELSCPGKLDHHNHLPFYLEGNWLTNQHSTEEKAPETETKQQMVEEADRLRYSSMLADLTSDDMQPTHSAADWLGGQIAAAKKDSSPAMLKVYEITCFSDYILLQLRLLTEKGVIIRRCKNCGQYFITERPNIDYCQRILPGETQTCYAIGPKRVFNRNLSADIPRALYSKAYKKYQARLRRQGITQEEFDTWREEAKEKLNDVQTGRVDLEEYTAWMEQ